mmetsp:Transcript_62463/g.116026  ORF Transcript_62463/g.116026 Transcript_62463/m.116026 type:complete len:338 (-) Transcript_62463:138-1151(-)
MGQASGCTCTQWPQGKEEKDDVYEKAQSKDGVEAEQEESKPQLDYEPSKESSKPQPEAVKQEAVVEAVTGETAQEPTPVVDAGTGQAPDPDAKGLQQRKYEEFLDGKATLGELSKTFVDVGDRRPSLGDLSIDRYVELHNDDFERLLALEKDPRWQFKKAVDGVTVHQFFDDKLGVAAIKAEAEMDCGKLGGLKYILECLLDPANRPQYDDVCKYGEMVEQRLPYYRVSYFQLLTPTPIISNRDVLLLGRLRFQEDGSLLIDLKSMEHPKMPPNPDFVRIDFKAGGYILRQSDKPGVWKVSFLAEVDPNGWLPMWLKSALAWKQSLVLAKFKSKYKL